MIAGLRIQAERMMQVCSIRLAILGMELGDLDAGDRCRDRPERPRRWPPLVGVPGLELNALRRPA